jgi:LysR family transcriptional regulator of abg operon
MSLSLLDMPMATHSEHLLARLRFRHLQLISEIDRTGSLSKASAVLSLTQPALSKALKEAEEMLGLVLFTRSARGLEKTKQGSVVIHGANLLIQELRHMQYEADAAGPEGRISAVLRLGAPAYLAVSLAPGIVSRLTNQKPSLMVSLHEDNVPNLLDALRNAELDALLTVYSSAAPAIAEEKELCFEKFAEEDYAVIGPAGHRLTRARNVPWEKLASESWVLTRKPSLARVFIEQSFLRSGVIPPSPVCETNSPVTSASLVAASVGLSCVPGRAMREAERTSDVKRIRVIPPPPIAALGLVYRAATAEHPRIRALQQAIRGLTKDQSL